MSTIVTSVSSSSTQVVQATPAPSALNALLDEVLEEVADLHEIDDMEGLRKLATVYFESADKEGFIFDFDDVWPLAGYARKDKAKRAIVGDKSQGATAGGLRRDIDVKISVKPSPLGRGIKSGHGGDRKTEQILLTHRGFSHFCYSARTLQGMMVRDFVISLVKGVRKLQKALDAGEVALVRREHRRQPVPLQLEASARERIKTCELTKAVSSKLCAPGKRMGPLIPFVHATINEAVMGVSKTQIAESNGVKRSSVVSRDYMKDAQQSQTSVFLALVNSFDDPGQMCPELLRATQEFTTSAIGQFVRYNPGEVPTKNMTLKRARSTVALIKDAIPSPKRVVRHPELHD